jgi:oxygen-independent coproporphyrinogen-3 oxidase
MMREWVGLGPSAASQHRGRRGSNVSDLGMWGERVGRGLRATEDVCELTDVLLAEDSLVFGLRMNAGVDLLAVKARCPDAQWGRVEALIGRLVDEGMALRDGSRLRLLPKGRLLADSIGSEIMVAFDRPFGAAACPALR